MFKRIVASFSLLLLLICSNRTQAQEGTDMALLGRMEDSLLIMADSFYNAPIPDTRIYYSEQFVKQLVRALKTPSSFNYPFKKLNDSLNIIL